MNTYLAGMQYSVHTLVSGVGGTVWAVAGSEGKPLRRVNMIGHPERRAPFLKQLFEQGEPRRARAFRQLPSACVGVVA